MLPKQLLTALVYTLPVLVVAFGVVMGAYGLLAAMQDAVAARVLFWIGMTILMIIVSNVILLVGALGLDAVSLEGEESSHESD